MELEENYCGHCGKPLQAEPSGSELRQIVTALAEQMNEQIGEARECRAACQRYLDEFKTNHAGPMQDRLSAHIATLRKRIEALEMAVKGQRMVIIKGKSVKGPAANKKK